MDDQFIKEKVCKILYLDSERQFEYSKTFFNDTNLICKIIDELVFQGFTLEIRAYHPDYIIMAQRWEDGEDEDMLEHIFSTGPSLGKSLMEVLIKANGP